MTMIYYAIFNIIFQNIIKKTLNFLSRYLLKLVNLLFLYFTCSLADEIYIKKSLESKRASV